MRASMLKNGILIHVDFDSLSVKVFQAGVSLGSYPVESTEAIYYCDSTVISSPMRRYIRCGATSVWWKRKEVFLLSHHDKLLITLSEMVIGK